MPLALTDLVDGQVFTAAPYNANNTAIESVINGGLTAANLSATAGILQTQLAGAYEHVDVVLRYGTGSAIPTAWPGGNARVVYTTLPGLTSDTGGDWTVTEIDWLCTDTGDAAGTGAFAVLWGGYTGNPLAWNTVATVQASTTMANGVGAGAQSANAAAITGLGVTLTRQTYPCYLVLQSTAAGANLLSAAADQIVVTVRCRRYIAST
jgi:hypothetical protein